MGKTYRDIHKANYNKFWETKPEGTSYWERKKSIDLMVWWKKHDEMWSLHNKDTWRWVAHCRRTYRIDGDYGLQRGWTKEKIIDREMKREIEEFYEGIPV